MTSAPIRVFVAITFNTWDIREVVCNLIAGMPGFSVFDWREQTRPGVSLVEAVFDQVKAADLVIVDLTRPSPSISMEAGMGFALGKPVLATAKRGARVPHHFADFRFIGYSDLLELERGLREFLKAFKSTPSKGLEPMTSRVVAPAAPKKLSMANIPGEPATRVFIGGNYREQLAILLEMRRFVNSLPGWTAIFANDFDMPRERTREESLRLLHNCNYAVFDVTSDGGQFVEIEHAPQYSVDFLLVFNTMDPSAPSKISAMLPKRREAIGYQQLDELKHIVEEWLVERRPP
jgi:hypothetical protein